MRSCHDYTCTNQKESLHSTDVHSDFLLQLTTHFTATLRGCKWPWRQLVWACYTTLVHSQGLGSSLFPKTKQQLHLSLHLWVCFLCSREVWPQGGPGAALCRQHNHIPQETHHQLQPRWGDDTLKNRLCMTKARQPQTHQDHKLIYWLLIYRGKIILLFSTSLLCGFNSLLHWCEELCKCPVALHLWHTLVMLQSSQWWQHHHLFPPAQLWGVNWWPQSKYKLSKYYKMKNTIIPIQFIAQHLYW